MDNMMQTCLIVALSFAVFSAVATVGASLALGIGFERLRAGYEVIRKQSGYFSDQIYKLDKRVDTLERSDHTVPAGVAMKDQPLVAEDKPSYLSVNSGLIAQARQEQSLGVPFDAPSASGQRYLLEGNTRPEGVRFH
ncbi:MAG: hypothetical protein JWO78_2346 [Micavibrio sp.]|nr:hypothetical protein [Micavibrio sp.]